MRIVPVVSISGPIINNKLVKIRYKIMNLSCGGRVFLRALAKKGNVPLYEYIGPQSS